MFTRWASSELKLGALGGGGTREAGGTVAESQVGLDSVLQYRVSTHQIRRRMRAAQSSTRQGNTELLCERIKDANREVYEGKNDLWPRSVFFLRGPTRSSERTGKITWTFFRDAQASPTQALYSYGPRYYNFPCFYMTCGLEKFGLVDIN